MSRFLSWLVASIPRAPRRAGILMRLYYVWKENFTYAGRVCASLFLFSVFAGAIAGFWVAWVFSGVIFLFVLALVPSLFMTARRTRISGAVTRIENATEGESAQVTVHYRADTPVDCFSLSCLRMDPSLECDDSEILYAVPAGGEGSLSVRIRTRYRGVFFIPKVALLVPEIKGMLCCPFSCGEAELLVYPRVQKVLAFPFLTMGQRGLAFVPLLMPDFMRGLDFAGVREYREGDSLRDLHHKAFARYGRPFTKEFESERGAGVVLLLDPRARSLREKSRLEYLVRLAGGIGNWLLDRNILGRFFVGDDEIPFTKENLREAFLEALARIPRAEIYTRPERSRGRFSRDKGARDPRQTSRDARQTSRDPRQTSRDPRQTSRGELEPWSPAARPMGPVLRLGLFEVVDPLVNKQVVVSEKDSPSGDGALYVPLERLDAQEVSL